MAANEYVQAAAAHLQSGATAIKTEMDQIRADFMNYERQVNSEINSKEADVRAHNSRLAAGQPDPTELAMHMRVEQLQKEIEGLKRDLADRKTQMNNALSAKEGAMNDLMSQSRGLQNKAASLK